MLIKSEMIFSSEISTEEEKLIFSYLSENKYKIIYSFDSTTGILSYIACLKKEYVCNLITYPFLPLYLKITINSIGQIIRSSNEYINVFIKYIYEKEKTMSDEELSSIYGDDLPQLKEIDGLSNQDYSSYKTLYNEFNRNLDEIEKDEKYKNLHEQEFSHPLNLELIFLLDNDSIYYDNQDCIDFKIKSGVSKSLVIKNKVEYLNSFVEKTRYNNENYLIDFSKQTILTPVKRVLNILANTLTNNFNPGYLYKHQLLKILLILRPTTIYINNDHNPYLVEQEIQQSFISFDENENLIFSPNIKDNCDRFILVENFIIVFANKRVTLYQFASENICKLYSFLIKLNNKALSSLKNVIKERIINNKTINLLKKVDLTDLKISETTHFNITLFVSFDKNDNLRFQTTYTLNNKIIEKKELLKNSYYHMIYDSYIETLTPLKGLEDGVLTSKEDIYHFLTSNFSKLRDLITLVFSDELNNLYSLTQKDLNVSLNYFNDWLNASIESEVFSQEEIKEILKNIAENNNFFRLGNKIIVLDQEQIKDQLNILKELKIDQNNLTNNKVPFFEALKLQTYEDLNTSIRFDNYIRNAIFSISNFKQENVSFPPSIQNEIKDYQIDAVKWMKTLSKNYLCGILADDMGLGKSLETIAFISNQDTSLPILIISQKSLIYNWENEFKKWLDILPTHVIDGDKSARQKTINLLSSAKKEAFITSYDSLRADLELYENTEFSLIILDEAQFIKNSKALKSQAVKKLNGKFRFALTGTPIENDIKDLWSIFDFLMPSYLYDESYFVKRFSPDNVEQDTALLKKITPFILRRNKKDVLKSLPPKTENTITLEMDDEQKTIYQAYLQKAKQDLKSTDSNKLSILTNLLRLREICIDPSICIDKLDFVSIKLTMTLKIINESIISGHKILIFSSFTKVLDHLKELLEEQNIQSYYINGKVKAKDRLILADKFNTANDVKVMLISLKAGGTGLNLIGADTLIHLDPWWNPALENQATDRVHRIGQVNPVNIYKLICHNTIEEKVIQLQQKKAELYSTFIKDGDINISSISMDDIKYILE